MPSISLDRQLIARLRTFSEISDSGFLISEGLTGTGVTVFRDQKYFGSWRVISGSLVWTDAALDPRRQTFETVDEAVRHMLLLILRTLEARRDWRPRLVVVN